MICLINHSHKKWKDSLITRIILIEISIILKFTKQPKISGSLYKNMAFSEENQLLAGDFHAVRDKINAARLQFTRNGAEDGLSKIKDTFA